MIEFSEDRLALSFTRGIGRLQDIGIAQEFSAFWPVGHSLQASASLFSKHRSEPVWKVAFEMKKGIWERNEEESKKARRGGLRAMLMVFFDSDGVAAQKRVFQLKWTFQTGSKPLCCLALNPGGAVQRSVVIFLAAFIWGNISVWAGPLDGKMQAQTQASTRLMLQNISRADTWAGVVVASPSKQSPNYYFHWIRDAALIIDQVVELYTRSPSSQSKNALSRLLADYVNFSRKNQITPNRSGGLGEPKFNVDGTAFDGAWGRPQNDGPALRAITLTHLAGVLLKEGREAYVRKFLYDGAVPTNSVIKADLEYVAHSWRQTSYDLWEEIKGMHFYTLMVQRKSLLVGAQLAAALGDAGAAHFYQQEAALIAQALRGFWNGQKGYLVATLGRDEGIDYKSSGLDAAVVLGALHGDAGDGFLSPANDMVLASSLRIQRAFQNIYPINQSASLQTAIGRYPEDRYDGNGTGGGNPWVLTTNAFAELYHRAKLAILARHSLTITDVNLDFFKTLVVDKTALKAGQILGAQNALYRQIVQNLGVQGDRFLARTLFHSNADGSLSEQINRTNGFMQGAANLTWSHASYVSAVAWRTAAASLRK